MPAPGKLGDDARAGISRRADNGDFHAILQAKIRFFGIERLLDIKNAVGVKRAL
jgi:hypothetical protein